MRYKGIIIICLVIFLVATLLTISCSSASKEFEATVTDVKVGSDDGIILSSLTIVVYFDNGEVIPFNGEGASGKFVIGKTYLVRCRQTYLSGEWSLDYLEER